MKDTISKIIAENLPGVQFGFCSTAGLKKPDIVRSNADGYHGAVMFIFPYNVKRKAPKNISRYAALPDYHDVIIPKLKSLAEILGEQLSGHTFRAGADYAPIPEVLAASRAGLGCIGKNGLLINKTYGSFVFIGEILTDIAFSDDSKQTACSGCGRCIAACPVGLDKSRCASAVTQKKGVLSDAEKRLIKNINSVFGCDICQNVCPCNETAMLTTDPFFSDGYRPFYTPSEDPAGRPYNWRGEEVIKRNYKILALGSEGQ